MPSLGADMTEGTLVEWRVSVGDHVTKGDVVAVVDTDKAAIDVEVFATGVVEEILVTEGTRVPVGTPLARIGAGDVTHDTDATTNEPPASATDDSVAAEASPVSGASPFASDATPEPTSRPEPPQPQPSDQPTPDPVPVGGFAHRHASMVLSPLVRQLADDLSVDTGLVRGTGPGGRITRDDIERAGRHRHRATPRARRAAREAGVDLDAATGTGPHGTIRAGDVERLAGRRPGTERRAPEPGSSPDDLDRRQAARLSIARTMERAWREIPHYRLSSTVDLEPTLRWLEALNSQRPPQNRVLPAAALLRATALAATEVHELNGWWTDDALHPSETVDLGTVVSLRSGGVVTPTIADAAGLGIEDTMAALRRLVAAARSGGLRSSDMTQASMTVTNLGDQGADEVHGVIRPPQVALVGFGRIRPRPWVVDDAVEVHRSVIVTLAADHRASDGRTGSRFLHMLERALSDPDRLLGATT